MHIRRCQRQGLPAGLLKRGRYRWAWLLCCLPLLSLSQCQKQGGRVPPPSGGPSGDTATLAGCERCLVVAEQSRHAVMIADAGRGGAVLWSWQAYQSGMDAAHYAWFTNPDDAKPVYGNRYMLINASGGGVALVRVADKKAVFYAHVGRNPHSSELLPDGNIVTASSNDNRLVVFHVDTSAAPGDVYSRVIPLPFAHNVVWDHKRQVLWSAGEDQLYKLRYNFNCAQPDLVIVDSVALPGQEAHDLFPDYGKDILWLTNPEGVYRIDMKTFAVSPAGFPVHENIKSVSSGPSGWPTIILKPTTSWWAETVLDSQGDTVYADPGAKIYKARWWLPNAFSYPAGQSMQQCKP